MNDEMKRLLLEFYTQAEAFEWLFAPHPQLDGKTPIEVIAEGRGDDALQTLRRLDSGVYL